MNNINVILKNHNTSAQENLFSAYGLYLTDFKISYGAPTTNFVSIPGRNGTLDLTEYLTGGVVHNTNASISITLERKASDTMYGTSIWAKWSGVLTDLYLSNDTTHYWQGRLTLSDHTYNRHKETISFTMEAQPFLEG